MIKICSITITYYCDILYFIITYQEQVKQREQIVGKG